ncbi:MAG: dihydroorotase [Chloroflexi bacterium]|nr:dihydroorotase [Chloroflexota bacterium]
MSQPLLIRGGRVIDPAQQFDSVADVLIVNGRVAGVKRGLAAPDGAQVIDAKGLIVTPGFIDLHCHLREPGQEEKETIATGTQAAARGGFTTVCCMPNTSPAIDTSSTVEYVLTQTRTGGSVRVLPIGAVTKGRGGKELTEMQELVDAGVVGFSDDGSPVTDAKIMRSALSYGRMLGVPVIDHCEDPKLAGGVMHEGHIATRLGLRGIPPAAEDVMVARDIALAELTGGHVHIAHLSTTGAVELVRRAKEKGLPVTAEATPHHLTLTDDLVALGAGERAGAGGRWPYDTNTKVNPPLRSFEHAAAVVKGIVDGVIDAIATDHAPHTAVDKLCEYDCAAFGISGLETALGVALVLVHDGRLPLPALVERLTSGPARVLGSKAGGAGTLREGALGDVAIFDPGFQWTVDVNAFASKGKNSPLNGATLTGKVVATIYGGAIVYTDGERVKRNGR